MSGLGGSGSVHTHSSERRVLLAHRSKIRNGRGGVSDAPSPVTEGKRSEKNAVPWIESRVEILTVLGSGVDGSAFSTCTT